MLLEARDKIEPLEKLVGRHFRGRRDELATLAAPQGFGPQQKRVLALTGIGGVGKSALIGRFILFLLDEDVPRPFVYLDFDRTEVDPGSQRKLIERMARNLGLLYAGLPSSQELYALEAIAAGDPNAPEESLADWLPTGGTDEELLRALRSRLELLGRDDLLLILDTFEQVAVRGPEVIRYVADFVELVLRVLPEARVVVSGRGQIALPLDMHPMRLEDLDPESADAVLEARGVDDQAVRSRIAEVMGRSPLVLRLASQAVKSGKLSLDVSRPRHAANGCKVCSIPASSAIFAIPRSSASRIRV